MSVLVNKVVIKENYKSCFMIFLNFKWISRLIPKQKKQIIKSFNYCNGMLWNPNTNRMPSSAYYCLPTLLSLLPPLAVLAFLPNLRLLLFSHLSSKFTKPSNTPTDLMVSTAYHYCLPLHSAPTLLFWIIRLSRRNCTAPVRKAWLTLIGAALVTFCEWVGHTKHTS